MAEKLPSLTPATSKVMDKLYKEMMLTMHERKNADPVAAQLLMLYAWITSTISVVGLDVSAIAATGGSIARARGATRDAPASTDCNATGKADQLPMDKRLSKRRLRHDEEAATPATTRPVEPLTKKQRTTRASEKECEIRDETPETPETPQTRSLAGSSTRSTPTSSPYSYIRQTTDLTRNLSAATMINILSRFEADMTHATFSIEKDRKSIPGRFSRREIDDMRVFFFDLMLGDKARTRIKAFHTYMTTHQTPDFEQGLKARAEVVACDTSLPKTLRKLALAMSRCHSAALSSNSIPAKIRRMNDAVELFLASKHLRDWAEAEPEASAELYQRYSVSAGQGVGHTTRVTLLLSRILDVDETFLRRYIVQAQGIYHAAFHWGRGIVVLLPPTTMTKVKNLGQQKFSVAMAILDDLIGDELRRLCDHVEQTVLVPILSGRLYSPLRVSEEGALELLSMIELISPMSDTPTLVPCMELEKITKAFNLDRWVVSDQEQDSRFEDVTNSLTEGLALTRSARGKDDNEPVSGT